MNPNVRCELGLCEARAKAGGSYALAEQHQPFVCRE